MKILFLSNFFPPFELGGYSQLCHEVAFGLMSQGHEFMVLTSQYRSDQAKQLDEPNVVRSLYLETDIDYYKPTDIFFKRSFQEKSNYLELQKTVHQFNPDLIFVWGMWNLSFNLPFWAETLMPRRVAYYISSYWPVDIDPHTQYWQQPANRAWTELLKKQLRYLALTQLTRDEYPPKLKFENAVCCSKFVRKILLDANKLPEKAGVLYNGIDPKPYKRKIGSSVLQNGSLRLLYFGRLIHDKGAHTALEALGQLQVQSKIANLQLTILGSGHPAYEAKLHQMIKDFNLDEHVNFVDQIPRDEIPDWLSRFDIYLFTSIWDEPMARSVMEAMAAGLLVIGSEVGGQTEMLTHRQNALTFHAEDAAGLASQIAYVLENPSSRLQMARAGQEMVFEKFTLDRMINEIEDYLLQVIAS